LCRAVVQDMAEHVVIGQWRLVFQRGTTLLVLAAGAAAAGVIAPGPWQGAGAEAVVGEGGVVVDFHPQGSEKELHGAGTGGDLAGHLGRKQGAGPGDPVEKGGGIRGAIKLAGGRLE